ncbi:MAG: prepilin peptidase [bacterium]
MYDTPFDMLVFSPLGPVVAAVWGAMWGSFLNVVIERLPRGESLLRPGSHCFSCGEPVRVYDNIPILSYLVLWGRCRHCGAGYSGRYALVEVLGLGLSVACFYHAARYGGGSAQQRLAGYLVEFFFVAGLLAVAFIDIRTMIIPRAITYPMVVFCTGSAIGLGRLPWQEAILGAAAGFLLVLLVWGLYLLIRGQEGIGWGDGMLLAVIGGFLGWKAIPLVLFLGSVQGLLVAVPMRLAGKSMLAQHSYHGLTDEPPDEDEEMSEGAELEEDDSEEGVPGNEDLPEGALPFGPFLALAGIEALFFGGAVVQRLSAVYDQLDVLL